MYRKLMTLAIVLGMLAAACGDSGSSDESPSPVTTSGGLSGNGDDGGSEETLPPLTVADVPGIDDDCEALVNVGLSLMTIFAGGDVPRVSRDAFSDLPGEIQDEVALVLDTFDEFAEGLEDIGVDLSDQQSLANLSEAQQQQFVALSERFDTPEFTAAIDTINAFGEEECSGFIPAP